MKKLPIVGLLVAASLLICVPASQAQFDDFLGNPTFEGEGNIGIDGNGNISASGSGSINVNGGGVNFGGNTSGGGWVDGYADVGNGQLSTGSRFPSEYRATTQGGGGGGGGGSSPTGQAAQGDQSHTTKKTLIMTDDQYKHNPAPGQMVESDRDFAAPSMQWVNQEMLYDTASTELLSLDSVNPAAVPSGSFHLGFPGPKRANLWGKQSGWAPGFGAAPHCSTSSCDFNVVDQ